MQSPWIFSPLHKNAKATDPGHLGYLFYILCAQFDEKCLGYHLRWGRVSRQSWGVGGCNLFQFLEILSRHFEKYLHAMKLKLTKHVEITIFLLHKQIIRLSSYIQNFYSEILNFRLFFAKIAIFRSAMFLWRHNYVTP